MYRRLTLAIATVAGLTAGSAYAADFVTMPVGGQDVPIHEPVSFDWNGFYAGIYGVGQGGDSTRLGLGVNVGVNAQFDFLLVGGEVALHGLTDGTLDTAYGQVLGRAGLLITDDVLLYAAAGHGIDLGLPADGDLLLGGGVELGLPGDISVRAQYLRGIPMSGADAIDQVTLGAHFHF